MILTNLLGINPGCSDPHFCMFFFFCAAGAEINLEKDDRWVVGGGENKRGHGTLKLSRLRVCTCMLI